MMPEERKIHHGDTEITEKKPNFSFDLLRDLRVSVVNLGFLV
jgi:hypothetical protein